MKVRTFLTFEGRIETIGGDVFIYIWDRGEFMVFAHDTEQFGKHFITYF